jgi:hypothetical protein
MDGPSGGPEASNDSTTEASAADAVSEQSGDDGSLADVAAMDTQADVGGDATADVLADRSAEGGSFEAAPPPDSGLPADGAPDAFVDAGTMLHKLRCGTTTGAGSRVQLTASRSLRSDSVRVAMITQNRLRAVVTDNPLPPDGGYSPSWLRAYTIDGSGAIVSTSPLQTGGGQVMVLDRYAGTPSGFVALFAAYDQTTMQNSIMVARLPDNSDTWVGPRALVPTPGPLNNGQATLYTINAAQDDYYIVLSLISGASQNVYAGEANASAGAGALGLAASYPTISGGNDAYGIASPGIAMNGTQAYVLLSPNGQNGPPPLGSAAGVLAPGAMPPTALLTPPSNLNYFPVGLTNASTAKMANVAILVADLVQLQGEYHIGQIGTSLLPSLDPRSLPGSVPTSADGGQATLKDLFISNQTAHWENVGGADQFLTTSPPIDLMSGYPGVNFGWWDAASGTLRALSTGDGALLTDVTGVFRADATFATLVGSIAQLWVAYLSTGMPPSMNNYPPPSSDLWVARVSCSL